MLILAQETVDLTSTVFTEAYYFFTVAIMWLLHVGFMTYEAGVSRRKNVMATAIKNILTIAVVTPVFYYVGWWVYFCMEEGFIPTTSADGNNPAESAFYFCGDGYAVPWEGNLGPNLGDNITGVFWAAFVLFSWTTGSIMSGSLIERVRTSAYLWLTALMGGIVWVIAAAWGWSFGGWLTLHFGYHDFAASGVVHGIAGIFTLGVIFNLGPRIGRYDRDGNARTFRPHNLHMTLQGLMIIFTGFYGFYAACLAITANAVPGWANIYFSPATLSAITFTITIGFAGGFAGGYFFSKRDPFWTISGGLAGVIAVSAGADIYAPSLVFILAFFSAGFAYYVGTWMEKKARIDDAVGAIAVHGFTGFLGVLLVGIFASGYPTGALQVETTFLGQLVGVAALFPLAFFTGYGASWILKKANILRVPPAVELEGLDVSEYGSDFFPEHAGEQEMIILADGSEVPAAPVLVEAVNDSSVPSGQARE
ncbi:MAG: ammonium transporter [Acidimicrobiales bacterium]